MPHGVKEVEAGASFEDLVCFDVPLKAAGELRLTLTAVQGEKDGSFRFAIPANRWKPQR